MVGYLRHSFTELAKGLTPGERIQAIADIQFQYETFLTDRNLIDQAGQRRLLLQALSAGANPGLFNDIAVLDFKNFNRLTPWQTELIKALGMIVPQIRVHLLCPRWIFDSTPEQLSGRKGPFSETLDLIAEFESLGQESQGLELFYQEPEVASNGDLALIAEHLFDPDFENQGNDPRGQIRILACTGRYHEVEEVGRIIWGLIRDGGVEPENIAVGVRDMSLYGDMLEDVFRRFRLPLFMRRGAPLTIQAPARAITAMMRLAISNFERELILDLLASPYLDFGLPFPWSRAAELTAKAGVTDDRAGGGYRENLIRLSRRSKADQEDAEKLVKKLDALRDMLRPLSKPQTWPDFVGNINRILDELRLESMILDSPPKWLKRDLTSLSTLRDCMDELVLAAEQTGTLDALPPDQLVWGLNRAMAERNVGERGQGAGGIRVMSVFDLHGLQYDHLFLVGLGEGEFPKPGPEGILVEDQAVQKINYAARQRIFTTSAARYRQEELVFYHAVSAARKSVVCTYTCSDENGRLMLASPLVDEIIQLFPDNSLAIETQEARNAVPFDRVLTRPELLGRLAWDSLAQKRQTRTIDAALDALKEYPEEMNRWHTIQARRGIEESRRTEPDGVFSGNTGPDAIKPYLESLRRYHGNLLVSPTLLEDFGSCAFAFWAKRIIGLAEPEAPSDEVHPMSRGAILHTILHQFLTQARDQGLLPLEHNDRTIDLLKTIARQEMERAEAWMLLGRKPLWQARQKDILRTLDRWLEFETRRKDDLVPQLFEWSFGPEEDKKHDAPPLVCQLSDGQQVFFQGRVDRIDVSDTEAWVLDYKDSKNATVYKSLLKPEFMGLVSFQPPVYQLAASRSLSKPAKAGYILLRKLAAKPVLSPDTGENLFKEDADTRRELAEQDQPNFLNHLDITWQNLTQGRFSIIPKDDQTCRHCDFRIACRRNTESENGE